jgi:pyridoxal phosphate enzyme (YggS family)
MINKQAWTSLNEELQPEGVTLVAVSKMKEVGDIQSLYDLGQRDFGENYVQELVEKQSRLPADIRWHFIGHLQSNKVKFIAPFVHMIHGVDSFKLLPEINKQAQKHGRVIDVLLQMHIAEEATKFGLDEKEIIELLQYFEAQQASLQHIRICGLMGMATATDDETRIRGEFRRLYAMFVTLRQSQFLAQPHFNTCSMGMSDDYRLAMEEGSTMVRIGSLLFGLRRS